jgi:hypothetical protein
MRHSAMVAQSRSESPLMSRVHFSRLVIQKSPWFADNKGGSYANRYIDTSAICMRIFRCIFLVSAPGQKFMKALKRLIGNGEKKNGDG